MSRLNTLLTLTEHFAGEVITLHPDRCLNARHRAVGCTWCAGSCPAQGAIAITAGRPEIDHEACLHCGLCLHRCPAGAFTRPDPLAGKLIKSVTALPLGPVDLLCPQQATPECGPAPLAVQTKRCLAALSAATLLELAAGGRELWLDDTACAACPLGKVHLSIGQTVSEANTWGLLIENSAPISLRTEQVNPPPATNRPVYEADQTPLSRRGFFNSLKQLGQESLGVAIDEAWTDSPESGRPVPVSERLPHHVPAERARILGIINKFQGRPAAVDKIQPKFAPKGQGQNSTQDGQARRRSRQIDKIQLVAVDAGQCSACSLCARFCPTGALIFLKDDEQFVLALQPLLCLGDRCNICPLACPEKVVSLEPTPISPGLLVKKPGCLAAGELTSCQKCGAPIAAGPGQPETCFVCRPKMRPHL